MSTYDGRKPEPPYPTPDDIESLRDDIESLRDDIESLRDDIESLREAAKLSEARARACELAKALIANTQGMSEGECGFWEHIEPLKTALADAEKGIE